MCMVVDGEEEYSLPAIHSSRNNRASDPTDHPDQPKEQRMVFIINGCHFTWNFLIQQNAVIGCCALEHKILRCRGQEILVLGPIKSALAGNNIKILRYIYQFDDLYRHAPAYFGRSLKGNKVFIKTKKAMASQSKIV